MDKNDIAFPNLGIYLHNVPKTFTLFGNFTIAMYGITFAIGVVGGLILASKLAKEAGQDEDTFWNFAIIEIICSLIGARIYYVVFAWEFYKNDFWSVFNLRQGGIAIYGAVIAAFITLFVFSKIKKTNPFIYGDAAIPGLVVGQIVGRWGNFFNREVFGEYTDSIFAMRIPVKAVRDRDISELQQQMMDEAEVNYIQAHPTFLYESLWNLCVLILLLCYRKHKKFNGEICLLYFAGYGIGRFWIEGIRTDQLKMIGTNIPVSQVVAIVLILIAIVGEILARTAIAKGKLPEAFRVKSAEECAAAIAETKKAAEDKKNSKRQRTTYVIKSSVSDEDKSEEDKSEEDKSEEDKSEENKAEEDKSEENKSEENKSEENKSEEDKSEEDKS